MSLVKLIFNFHRNYIMIEGDRRRNGKIFSVANEEQTFK